MARVPDAFDYEDEQENPEPHVVQCRLCGSPSVYWQQNMQTGKWELRDISRVGISGKLHACKPEAVQAYLDDAFDDES